MKALSIRQPHAEAIMRGVKPIEFHFRKIMVIDGATVMTGSFKFTKRAEDRNAENLLVIRDKALADKYAANWEAHATHCEVYERKEKGLSE